MVKSKREYIRNSWEKQVLFYQSTILGLSCSLFCGQGNYYQIICKAYYKTVLYLCNVGSVQAQGKILLTGEYVLIYELFTLLNQHWLNMYYVPDADF